MHSVELLDGGIGTELVKRGVEMRSPLDRSDAYDDYWTGWALLRAPGAIRRIHDDYVSAGADVLTANTFRVNRAVVQRLGLTVRLDKLLQRAISIARAATEKANRQVLVGASIGPVAAWDAPNAAPSDRVLREIHAETVAAVVDAGVDILLPETMNSIRESIAVCELADASGLPFMLSLCPRSQDTRLRSGETLTDAVAALLPLAPDAVLVNHCSSETVDAALDELAGALSGSAVRFGARVHLEKSRSQPLGPRGFACAAHRWIASGASVIGGCCGTGPAHIAALAAQLDLRVTGDCRQ